MNLVIYVLLTCHFLGDFNLQTDNIVKKKKEKISYLLLHCLIYTLVILVGSFLCFLYTKQNKYIFMISSVLIFVSHFFIDWVKIKIEKNLKYSHFRSNLFLIDQIFHIFIIILVLAIFQYNSCSIRNLDTYKELIKIIFIVVVLTKPSSVFIKSIFNSLFCKKDSKPDENNTKETKDAGQFIGILERIIISLFLLLEQYGAVGLVLTAKSIARFKQLEDKNFAEKYLIGTLLSFIIALIFSVMIIKW